MAHLKSLRVDAATMFRVAAPTQSGKHLCATSVTVGDFVEVDADRSPGWNSEGGIAMVIAVVNHFSDVK